MTITHKNSYVTSDNRSFDNEVDAHKHERVYRLKQLPFVLSQDTDTSWLEHATLVHDIILATPRATS